MKAASAPAMPLRTRLQLRWADTDGYGHVNNVAYLRYIEEARIRTFGLPDRPASAGGAPRVFDLLGTSTFTVTAGQRVEYIEQLRYGGQEVVAEVWLSALGSRSAQMAVAIRAVETETVYFVAQVALVFCDVRSGASRRLTERERDGLAAYVAPPITFREDRVAAVTEQAEGKDERRGSRDGRN